MSSITLTEQELIAITGYEQPCKQLRTLHNRGFYRAYIARKGGVILERSHYEAVTKGEEQKQIRSANLSFMRGTA